MVNFDPHNSRALWQWYIIIRHLWQMIFLKIVSVQICPSLCHQIAIHLQNKSRCFLSRKKQGGMHLAAISRNSKKRPDTQLSWIKNMRVSLRLKNHRRVDLEDGGNHLRIIKTAARIENGQQNCICFFRRKAMFHYFCPPDKAGGFCFEKEWSDISN